MHYFKYNFDFSNSNFKLQKIYEAIIQKGYEKKFNKELDNIFKELIGDIEEDRTPFLIDYGLDFLFKDQVKEYLSKEKNINLVTMCKKYLNNISETRKQTITIDEINELKNLFNNPEDKTAFNFNFKDILNSLFVKNFDSDTIDFYLKDNDNVLKNELNNFYAFRNSHNHIENILINSNLNYKQIRNMFNNEDRDIQILGYIIDYFSKFGKKPNLPKELLNYDNLFRLHSFYYTYALKNFDLNDELIQAIISSNEKKIIKLLYKSQYNNLNEKQQKDIENTNFLTKEEIFKVKKLTPDEIVELLDNYFTDTSKDENIKNILTIIKKNTLTQEQIKKCLEINHKQINTNILKTQIVDENILLENLNKFNISLLLHNQNFSFEAIKTIFKKKSISKDNFFYIRNNYKYRKENKFFEDFYETNFSSKENKGFLFNKNIVLNNNINKDEDLLNYDFLSNEKIKEIAKNDVNKKFDKRILIKENISEDVIKYYLNYDGNPTNYLFKIEFVINNINYFVKNKNTNLLNNIMLKLKKNLANNKSFKLYNFETIMKIALNLTTIKLMQNDETEIYIDVDTNQHRENFYDCTYVFKKCEEIKPKVDLTNYLGLSL